MISMGKIQELCKEKKISMAALAELCGYNPNSFYNAASRGRISKGIADKIREIYPEISLDWLLGDSDYMTAEAYEKARAAEIEKGLKEVGEQILAFTSLAKARGFSVSFSENAQSEMIWRISSCGHSPKSVECTGTAFIDFYNDVCSHIDLSFKRFIEKNKDKGGVNNG